MNRVGRINLVAALIPALGVVAAPALAQGLGAGRGEPDPITRQSRLGASPGAGANPLGSSPGAGEAVLEGRLGAPGPRFLPEPFPQQNQPEILAETGQGPAFGRSAVLPPGRRSMTPTSPFGTLSVPTERAEDGAPGALTLDQAIDLLVHRNLDLYSKSFEIPQADADILTAGLRANPVLYTDVQCVPYGSFSLRRPGGQTQYDLNVTYPLDVTRKRQARTSVAVQAKKVLQAQLQDAVRLEIDNLYTEFIDVLASRETVREARQAVEELVREPTPVRPPLDDDQRLEIQREAGEIALVEAQEQYRTDLRTLGALLKMSPAEAERLEVRGSLQDLAPPPAGGTPLLQLALTCRPDLNAYRLGVGRARADVQLALANRYPDLFVLYQPYTFQDDRPLRERSAHSWGVGVAIPLPLFNRNQGNIQRARLNVAQSQVELSALEDRIAAEVRQAERLYQVTRTSLDRIERSLLPRAEREHDRITRLYLAGQVNELTFLTAERDFDQVARQYRDILVRHRRSMLKLNTTVGQRIVP